MGDIRKAIDAMRWAADSNRVGYSQSDRWGVDFYGGGYYNADCSSLVIQALRYAGYDTGNATYTGNMSGELCARGWTRVPADGNPQPGDILLNDVNHVAMWLGDCLAQASIDENGNIAGGARGDQTGAEVNTRGYYDYPWDCYLRPPAEDVEPEKPKRKKDNKMQCLIRPNGENYMVYFDGTKAHPLKHPDEMKAIQWCYSLCNDGEEIPCFEFGGKSDPWATRLFEGAGR